MRVWLHIQGSRVWSRPHTFVEIDHSPPFGWIIQEGLLSVTSKSMCTKYWLTACSSLPRKSVVRWTDRPAMTIAVHLGRKATKQTNKTILHSKILLIWSNVNFSFRHEQQEVLYRHRLIISYLCCCIHWCLCGTFCTVCSLGLVPVLLVSSKGNQLDRRRRHQVGKQSKWFLPLNVLLCSKLLAEQ